MISSLETGTELPKSQGLENIGPENVVSASFVDQEVTKPSGYNL